MKISDKIISRLMINRIFQDIEKLSPKALHHSINIKVSMDPHGNDKI